MTTNLQLEHRHLLNHCKACGGWITPSYDGRHARAHSAVCPKRPGLRGLTPDEIDLMTHISRWGSDGYPVHKFGHKWDWQYRSLQSGRLYSTKREAVLAFEAYYDILRDAKAGRI